MSSKQLFAEKNCVAVSCDYRICLDLMIVESTNSIKKWNENIHIIIIITHAMYCAKLLHLLEQNWRNASPSFPTSENQFHRWLSCVRCLVLGIVVCSLQYQKAMPTISKYQRMNVTTISTLLSYHHFFNYFIISIRCQNLECGRRMKNFGKFFGIIFIPLKIIIMIRYHIGLNIQNVQWSMKLDTDTCVCHAPCRNPVTSYVPHFSLLLIRKTCYSVIEHWTPNVMCF